MQTKIKIPSRRRGTLTLRRLVLSTCAFFYAMGGQSSSITNLFHQVSNFMRNVNHHTSGTNQDDDSKRTITVNHGPQSTKFLTNYISTSKYSILSFLPKFLFEQFRKYSNIFFLCIAVLQVDRFFLKIRMNEFEIFSKYLEFHQLDDIQLLFHYRLFSAVQL